jgi:hypothetical protein
MLLCLPPHSSFNVRVVKEIRVREIPFLSMKFRHFYFPNFINIYNTNLVITVKQYGFAKYSQQNFAKFEQLNSAKSKQFKSNFVIFQNSKRSNFVLKQGDHFAISHNMYVQIFQLFIW